MTLQFASEKLRGNKDVVLGAVKSLPQAFQFARDALRRGYIDGYGLEMRVANLALYTVYIVYII